jgi:serine/threonine protein kinase
MDTQTRVIAGRYELINRIGVGGVAYVYLARDQYLGRLVAIKVLTPGAAADPAFVERFKREAKAIAGLKHPNIVTVYDWGSGPEADYMVMEYVPGGNLADHLRKENHLGEAEALEIASGVASALEAAHQCGIIHRDIKPRNVLLDAEGRPEVADFGAAQAQGLTHLTQTNAVVGTASYLSPEQAQGRAVDERSDVYSLGVVLYEMLTGRPPFTGESMVDVAMQHVGADPVPPRQLEPEVSPETEAVILKALAKNPADRYQNARAMREAIQRAQRNLERTAAIVRSGRLESAPQRSTLMVPPIRARTAGRQLPPPETTRFDPLRALLVAIPILALVIVAAAALALHGKGASTQAGSRTSHGSVRSTVRPARAHPTAAPTRVVANVHPAHQKPAPAHRAQHSHPVAAVPQATSVPATSAPATSPPSLPASAPVQPAPTTPPSGPVEASAQGSTRSPTDTVILFYTLVGEHRFADARALWSPSLQSTYAPSVYIDQRFAPTQSITVQRAAASPPSGGTDTVEVSLTEVVGPPGQVRHYSGSWQLVNSGSGWLLNWPNLRQTS